MKGNLRILLVIACLTLATLACQALAGGSNNTTVPEAPPIDTSAPEVNAPPTTASDNASSSGSSDTLLKDDFSGGRIQWGTGTNFNDSVEYKDEALNFQVFTPKYIVWTTPNDKDYENIHMEVTVINNGTDSNTAFGLQCNVQHPITDSHYYFAITPAGQYAIAKASLVLDDIFLTNNDEWGDSDLIAKDADSYRLGAACGNGVLTLYVDGQQVASVEDSTYTSGGIGLFAWSSSSDTATTNISFDDFVMTSLP